VKDVINNKLKNFRSESDRDGDDNTKFSKLDEDLDKFGIGDETKRIVKQKFAGNPEEKHTNKEEGAGDPLL